MMKKYITSMLAEYNIQIGGNRPWNIQIFNENLYQRVMLDGTLCAWEHTSKDGGIVNL